MHLKLVSDIKSDEYYINMMIAWYFAPRFSQQNDTRSAYSFTGELAPGQMGIMVHTKNTNARIKEQ